MGIGAYDIWFMSDLLGDAVFSSMYVGVLGREAFFFFLISKTLMKRKKPGKLGRGNKGEFGKLFHYALCGVFGENGMLGASKDRR